MSLRVKTTSDLFTASGQSPWWAAGLSGFMTMFSAGTFVVWGGIAYRLGIVAILINFCYGISAILVGYFVAGRWKRLGIRTPAQYVTLRFGTTALHFYTWTMMAYRLIGVAVALYSLAVLISALMPLPPENMLRDPTTGNIAIIWGIVLFGGLVVIYTMLGGLWGVLMTDVFQFIILNTALIFTIPLIFADPAVGGLSGFIENAPIGFFSPTADKYTWYFIAGWCAIHFFMVGAEWAFVQRFLCVKSEIAARKSCYLFGVLYIISPILWLTPPLLYRLIEPIPPNATDSEIMLLAENAYVRACQHVLPVGMVGMMVAAMCSATASMISSQLNVFAGVLTEDIYRNRFPKSNETRLLWVGRSITLLLGIVLIGLALLVSNLGGAEKVIVTVTSLMATALLAPSLWGLFSRSLKSWVMWLTVLPTFAAGLSVKFVLQDRLASWGSLPDLFVGVILPLGILAIASRLSRTEAPGWAKLEKLSTNASPTNPNSERRDGSSDALPYFVISSGLLCCGFVMGVVVLANRTHSVTLMAYAFTLLALAAVVGGVAWREKRSSN